MTRARLVMLLLLAAGGLAWLVERLIVTDAEAIESKVTSLASTASAKDWEAFEALLADEFESTWGDRTKFTRMVGDLMRQYDVSEAGVACGETTVRGDRGAVSITVLPGAPYKGFRIPGRVDLVRTGDGWRVTGIASDLPTPSRLRVR